MPRCLDHVESYRWRDLRQAIVHPALNTTIMAIAVVAIRVTFVVEPTALSFVLLTVSGGLAYLAAVYASTRTMGYAAPTALLKLVRQAAG